MIAISMGAAYKRNELDQLSRAVRLPELLDEDSITRVTNGDRLYLMTGGSGTISREETS